MNPRTVRHYVDKAKKLSVQHELTSIAGSLGLFSKHRGAILPGDQQHVAILGLMASEETLATQHGLERWEP